MDYRAERAHPAVAPTTGRTGHDCIIGRRKIKIYKPAESSHYNPVFGSNSAQPNDQNHVGAVVPAYV